MTGVKADQIHSELYSRRLNIGLHEPEARRHIPELLEEVGDVA